jgi:hypothetical protein
MVEADALAIFSFEIKGNNGFSFREIMYNKRK